MTAPPTVVVFDTVTLLQAGATPAGPAGVCLRLVMEGMLTLCMSVEGLQEVHDVLTRAKTRSRFPSLSDEAIETFLDGLRSVARIVPEVRPVVRYARDPDDEHILNLIVAAQARFLVTRDKDLLDLTTDSSPEGEAFRRQAPLVRILDPVSFLNALALSNPAPRGETRE